MEVLKIKGKQKLEGKIKASGAKNAMTKLLVASLLSDRKCTFYNVPNIGDVEITVNLCKEIGSVVFWDKEKQILEIMTKELKTSYVPQKYSGANRIPILMIGALLGRTGEDIIVPTIGGDLIGARPVDFHIQALRKLGAYVEYREMKKEGAYFASAHNGLKGCIITLPYPSVGATENCILSAIRARGTTIIENAAIEPEIVELIMFLQKMGVQIALVSDRKIEIRYTQVFKEVEHTVLTDRNEVASYAMAAIATQGKVFIEGAQHLHMISFLHKLGQIGGAYTIKNNGIEFYYDKPLQGGLLLETDVHPGFMTDWQQPFVVLLTQAHGTSIVHETVYENRFGYTQMLKSMGADIEIFSSCLGGKPCRFAALDHLHSVVIKGPKELKAQNFSIPDLRAGFAYVMAALLAEDESVVSNVDFLDRGYEHLVQKLSSLGALISRDPLVENPYKQNFSAEKVDIVTL